MFHSALPAAGKQVGHGVASIRLAVARVSWRISFELSCCLVSAAADATIAATPAVVGIACDVEPSGVETENSECAPYEVSVERLRNVRVAASLGDDWPMRLDWSATTELPGHTCAKRMPSVWSEDSKSFDAQAMTTPRRYATFTAARTERVCPSEAGVTSMTFSPASTANTMPSATRSGRSIASSPIFTDSRRQFGHTPAPAKLLSASPAKTPDSPFAWL